jgi:hypothetical protein
MEFENDLELYNQRIARFYHYSREARPPISNSPNRQPRENEWFRLRFAQAGRMKFEEMDGRPSDSKDESHLIRSWSFHDGVWEQCEPNRFGRKTSVIIDKVATPPPLPQVLGLGSPLSPANGLMLLKATGPPPTLVDFLREAEQAGLVSAPSTMQDSANKDLVELKVKKRLDKSTPAVEFYAEVTIQFDPAHGMAPARVSTTELHLRDGKFVDVSMPMGFDAEWNDFEELKSAPGLWLPRRITIREWMAIVIPKSGDDFQPLLVDGKPVYTNNVQDIDISQTNRHKYERMVTEFKVASIDINGKLDEEVFVAQHPEGTVVVDRRSKDVYELNSAGAALNATSRTMIDGPSVYPESFPATAHPPIDEPNDRRTAIIALKLVAVIQLAYALFLRKRRGSNRA